jgi:hypothetical protein
MIRAARKLACELRGPRKEKAKKPEEKSYRAFITLEDQVGIHHLAAPTPIQEVIDSDISVEKLEVGTLAERSGGKGSAYASTYADLGRGSGICVEDYEAEV